MAQLRLTHRLRAVLAAVTTSFLVTLLAPPLAHAHADPNIEVRLDAIRPALPSGVDVTVLDAAVAYLTVSNPTPTPATVLDPDGQPILQVSSAGVVGDLSSPFLPTTGRESLNAESVTLPCCPDGRWAELSTETSWAWPDPRLDPPALRSPQGVQRGLASLQDGEPLARWSIGLRYGDQKYTVDGVLDQRPLGQIRTAIQAAPAGISVSVIEARPPQVRLVRPRGTMVVVLGRDGKPFLRITDEVALARSASLEYNIHRRAVGLIPKTGKAWVPFGDGSSSAPVVWADQRVGPAATPAGLGAERVTLAQWTIPVEVNGRADVIRGMTFFEPKLETPGDPNSDSPVWNNRTSYLLAGGLTLVLVVAYRFSRRSSGSPQHDDARRTEEAART